jgi:hypothetical protein
LAGPSGNGIAEARQNVAVSTVFGRPMINLIRVTRKAGWTSTRLAREGRGTVAAGPRTGDVRIHIVSVRGWLFVTPQTVARDLMMVFVAAGTGGNTLGRGCGPAMALRTRHALVFAMIER